MRQRTRFRLGSLAKGVEGSSLIEFAVSLPLLVVLVVGITDFGGAFNMKQELNNAAREGARFGAAQPSNDLCTGCAPPPSVNAIFYLVDSYLTAAGINDCGLTITNASAGGPIWTYKNTNGNNCAGTFALTITRPLVLSEIVSGTSINLQSTEVQISYPFSWHFNSVIQLVAPGSSVGLNTPIVTDATAVNQD